MCNVGEFDCNSDDCFLCGIKSSCKSKQVQIQKEKAILEENKKALKNMKWRDRRRNPDRQIWLSKVMK